MYVLLLLFSLAFAQEWPADTYPNPRKDFADCKMRSPSNVCDPDEILTESERYRLNGELTRLASRTERGTATYCDRKGVESVLVIVPQGSRQLAQDLKRLYIIDPQCKRGALFMFSSGDRKFYLVADPATGINPAEFEAIVSGQEMLLSTGKYTSGMVNVFKEIGGKEVHETTTAYIKSSPSIIFSFVLFLVSIFIFY